MISQSIITFQFFTINVSYHKSSPEIVVLHSTYLIQLTIVLLILHLVNI
ncbi:hypothetical protein HOB94_07305 [bacterium]|nr:hypothetical protein [bacterium]